MLGPDDSGFQPKGNFSCDTTPIACGQIFGFDTLGKLPDIKDPIPGPDGSTDPKHPGLKDNTSGTNLKDQDGSKKNYEKKEKKEKNKKI